MSKFTEGLSIKEEKVDRDVFSLLTPLVWEVDKEGSGKVVQVPVGFASDGASIPWPVSIVFPRWGRRYRRPAVLHDYLLDRIKAGQPDVYAPKRKNADWQFLVAMKACGVSLPVRWAFYLAVRVAGILKG